MKTLTLDFTANKAPSNIDATLAHHNISATTRILRTYPSTRIEIDVDDDIDAQSVLKLCNANAVMAPRSK